MQFRGEFYEIEFNLPAYKKALRPHMDDAVQRCARAWLAAVLRFIPTWSRASRATFESLAQAVGYNIQYGPILAREDRLTLGLQTGRGGVSLTKTKWTFFYETDLRYLAYNEYNHVVYGQAPNVFSRSGLTHPTPYKFQEAGQIAFEDAASKVRLPNPMSFIKGKRI